MQGVEEWHRNLRIQLKRSRQLINRYLLKEDELPVAMALAATVLKELLHETKHLLLLDPANPSRYPVAIGLIGMDHLLIGLWRRLTSLIKTSNGAWYLQTDMAMFEFLNYSQYWILTIVARWP